MTICKIDISDSVVSSIISNKDGSLDILVVDWQEKEKVIHFSDASSFLSFNSIGCELSHMEESSDDKFKDDSQKYTDEDLSEMICYKFISAWSNNVVIKILALPNTYSFKK